MMSCSKNGLVTLRADEFVMMTKLVDENYPPILSFWWLFKTCLTKISQKSDKIINHEQNGLAHMNCYSQKAV